MITDLIIPVINTDGNDFDYKDTVDNIQMHINVRKEFKESDVKYDFYKAQALIMDSNKQDINDVNYILSKLNTDKKIILIININPTTLEPDAESELKSWVDESKMVLSNEKLDNQMKISALPTLTMQIMLNNEKYTLENCKMFENYSNKKFPLYFAILVNRIID